MPAVLSISPSGLSWCWGSHTSQGFILRRPWISARKLMSIHQTFIKIFQLWPKQWRSQVTVGQNNNAHYTLFTDGTVLDILKLFWFCPYFSQKHSHELREQNTKCSTSFHRATAELLVNNYLQRQKGHQTWIQHRRKCSHRKCMSFMRWKGVKTKAPEDLKFKS